MIRHSGSLRSFRLALALLLAGPWADALATAGAHQAPIVGARAGAGWRREPAPATPQIVRAQGEDFDEADDGPGTHPAPDLAAWPGFGAGPALASAEAIAPAAGAPRSWPPRYKSLCRFRC